MELISFGPNVSFKDGVTFHVHAAGCAHLRQQPYASLVRNSDAGGDTFEASTVAEVTEFHYPASDFDYDPDDEVDSAAYRDDATIFPCTKIK